MIDDLLTLASTAYGDAMANLLRADFEIAKRERDNPPVPQAWRDKRREMARALDRKRARLWRELRRARLEFYSHRD